MKFLPEKKFRTTTTISTNTTKDIAQVPRSEPQHINAMNSNDIYDANKNDLIQGKLSFLEFNMKTLTEKVDMLAKENKGLKEELKVLKTTTTTNNTNTSNESLDNNNDDQIVSLLEKQDKKVQKLNSIITKNNNIFNQELESKDNFYSKIFENNFSLINFLEKKDEKYGEEF